MEEVCALTTGQVETFRNPASDGDSDDEPVILLRRRSKAGQLRLQADSDEDDDGAVSAEVPSAPRVDPPEANGMDVEEESNGSNEEKSTPKAKTGKRRIVKLDSSSEEDESAEQPCKSYVFRNKFEGDTGEVDSQPDEVSAENRASEENVGIAPVGSPENCASEKNLSIVSKGSPNRAIEENLGIALEVSPNRASEENHGIAPEESNRSLLRNKILANSDLFDAEGSSGDEVERDDAGNEDGVSLEDIKKAARRSTKTTKKAIQPAKRPKLKKGDVQQLHSDSQRIMRQSRVSLPYHVPQQRTLDDFLNRRKIVPKSIKPSAKETESILKKLVKVHQKPATICQLVNAAASSNKPENPEPSSRTNLEASVSKANPEPSFNSVKRRLDLKSPGFEHTSLIMLHVTPGNAQNADGGGATKDLPQSLLPNSDDEDDLPDLVDNALSPLKPSMEPSFSVLNVAPCPLVADDSENPEPNPSTDNLALVSSASEKKADVERKTEVSLEMSASGPNSKKLKISLEEVAMFKPRLSGAPHMIIDLDDMEDDNVPLNSSTPLGKQSAGPQKVVLSILKKEKDSSGEERLVNENLTVMLSDETRPSSQTPGSTLLCLKEKLKAEIAKRRAEARQKRMLMLAVDDEEGFEGDHESENDSEEEDILSDPTDSEEGDEDDDECEIIGKELKKAKKPKNAFIDEEAEDEDNQGSDDDDEGEQVDDEKEVEGMAEETTKDKGVRLRLQLESDSSEDETLLPLEVSCPAGIPPLSRCNTIELFPASAPDVQFEDDDHRPPLARDTSMESSFELMGSLIPAHQPGGGMKSNRAQSVTPLKRHYSVLSLPIEDSQDLFSQHVPAEEPNYALSPFNHCAARTLMEESPELAIQPKLGLFDEDNLSTQDNANELFNLCSGSWADSAKRKSTGLEALCDPISPKNTQETMDELMDLCSGKFTSKGGSSNVQYAVDIAALCDPLSPKDTQGRMDQLFDLCSGKFTAPTENGDSSQRTDFADNNGETQDVIRSSAFFDMSDDELSISSLKSISPQVRRKRLKRILSDAESDEEDRSDLSDEEVVDAESVKKENKKIREFFEDEAELSGSDVPSDEDDEIAEEDDILEEELGDMDMLAEDELKNQVEKVHMKMMMDDDQRQLRLYKEMYLEDGDLHMEGQGRVRKFRWRNVDDDSNDRGGLKRDSDSEGEDGENDAENAAFRMQRHEREKWLSEHKKSHAGYHDVLLDDAEASQFKALKKVNVLRRSSSLAMKASNSPILTPTLSKQSPNFCGSFLARGKDALAKIAELTKGSGKDCLNGPRNSRNFVFSVVSPTKEAQAETPKLRRAASTPSSVLPAAKKCRLEALTPVPNNDSSIFDLL